LGGHPGLRSFAEPDGGWVNQFNSPMLDVVPGVTRLGHHRGTMMHSFLVGAVYVLMVIAPCVIALFSGADHSSSESDGVKDGFR